MKWAEVLADPSLQDIPYKVELNEWGQIVMTPASNKHGILQSKISAMLQQLLLSGLVITECSIDTPSGVKVADVAWISDHFLAEQKYRTPYEKAPDICVEVISPSNAKAELEKKKQLYFIQGAQEVWFCDDSGSMQFFLPDRETNNSQIVTDFPTKIVI